MPLRFESVIDILKEYFTLRLKYYQKRKDFLEGMFEAEAEKLRNQARFILEKCSGELVVENKKRKTIVDELIKRGYKPDPIKEWKSLTESAEEEDTENREEEERSDEEEEEVATTSKKKPSKDTGKRDDRSG